VRSEREGGLTEGLHRAPPPPLDANRIGQTDKAFEDPSMPRKISSRSLPPLGRFFKNLEERKRYNKARALITEFQI
jgi:hypothetical protein